MGLYSQAAKWGCAELPEVKRKWPISCLQKCRSGLLSHRNRLKSGGGDGAKGVNCSHSHLEHTGGSDTDLTQVPLFLQQPAHPAERSTQVDCFTQLTAEGKGEMGYLFPLSILQDSRAQGVFYNHVCSGTEGLSVLLHQGARIILCLKWIFLSIYHLCLSPPSAKLV